MKKLFKAIVSPVVFIKRVIWRAKVQDEMSKGKTISKTNPY